MDEKEVQTTAEEKKKGRLLQFGLRNGQVLVVLTEKGIEDDGARLILRTTGGETVTILEDEVVFTRSKEVEIPTGEEVEEFVKDLLHTVGRNLPSPGREPSGYGHGQYL